MQVGNIHRYDPINNNIFLRHLLYANIHQNKPRKFAPNHSNHLEYIHKHYYTKVSGNSTFQNSGGPYGHRGDSQKRIDTPQQNLRYTEYSLHDFLIIAFGNLKITFSNISSDHSISSFVLVKCFEINSFISKALEKGFELILNLKVTLFIFNQVLFATFNQKPSFYPFQLHFSTSKIRRHFQNRCGQTSRDLRTTNVELERQLSLGKAKLMPMFALVDSYKVLSESPISIFLSFFILAFLEYFQENLAFIFLNCSTNSL